MAEAARRAPSLTMRVLLVALAILLVPGFFQGCAGCTCEECFAQGVASSARRDAAKDYVYSAPLSRTEAVLRERLGPWGYAALPAPLERGKKISVKDAVSDTGSLRIEVVAASGERYRLHLYRLSQSTMADGGVDRREERALDFEWDVASEVDSTFRDKTNADADERTERAKSIGRGCDRGCELGCRACRACEKLDRSPSP